MSSLCLLFFRRFDHLERMMDDKLKMLFDFANNLSSINTSRSTMAPVSASDDSDNKTTFVFDRATFTK